MLVISYNFYRDEYGGTSVSEENFSLIINRTIGIANGYLSVDLFDIDESSYTESSITRLKLAICAASDCVASCLVAGSNETKKIVSGESVSGIWSKSYSNSADDSSVDLRNKVYSVLEDFLSGTEYLVRGYYIHG